MKFEGLKTGAKAIYTPAENLKLRELHNCTVHNGCIQSRKGFSLSPEDFVFRINGSEDFETTFKITDCYMFLDGEYGRVAVSVSDNLSGTVTYRMMFLSCEGKSKLLGYIEFTSNGEDFGYPESFTVFKGRPTKGLGVYFMVRRVYSYWPNVVEVRELATDKKTWAMLTDSDIYAPLVLANGRGESYHVAVFEGKELGLPSPIMPESKNLLGTRFRAAYTTDGISYAFSLPYTRLDNERIQAELLYKGNIYTFTVPKDDRQSQVVKIEELDIILYADRPVGRIYFSVVEGSLWAPLLTGELNNLCVTASKTHAESRNKIAAMTACSTIDSRIPFDQNVATVFYGNQLSPSLVVLNSQGEPLYFPENLANGLGDAEKQVIYATSKDGKLLAFKAGEIYSAELETAATAKKITLLGETVEISGTTCALKKTADFAAAPKATTFYSLSGSLLFQAEDNSVWEVNGPSKVVRIAETEEGFEFATVQKDKYILLKGNKAAVLQRNEDGYVIGKWSLPLNAVGGFSYLGKSVFFFEYLRGSVYTIFPALYNGENDFYLKNEFNKQEIPVVSKLSVNLSNTEKRPIRLYKITVDGSGKEAKLCLFEGEKKVAERKTAFKNSLAKFFVGAVGENLCAELSFSGETTLFGIITEQKQKS